MGYLNHTLCWTVSWEKKEKRIGSITPSFLRVIKSTEVRILLMSEAEVNKLQGEESHKYCESEEVGIEL